MPVHPVYKNGKIGYQWGKTGKVYFGPQGKQKAQQQGAAIKASEKGDNNNG